MPRKAKDGGPSLARGTATAAPLKSEGSVNKVDSINEAYLLRVDNAVSITKSKMKLIAAQGALDIGQGGYINSITPDDFKAGMAGPTKSTTGGISIFMLNLLCSFTPGVPYNVTAIDAMVDRYDQPMKFLHTVIIPVDGPEDNPFSKIGSLISVSPPEYNHAFILACARDLKKDCSSDVVNKWKRALLSVPAEFVIAGNDSDKYARAVNEREQVAESYEAVYWTTFQRIFAIHRYRLSHEAVNGSTSSKAVAEAYNAKITLARRSEPVTPHFVDSANTIIARAFNMPDVQQLVQECDMLYGHRSPFDSISKLQGIISKSGTPELIRWVVNCIADLYKSNQIKPGNLGHAELTGYGKGGKGLVDVLILKYQIKEYMLLTLCTKHSLELKAIEEMRRVLVSHQAYREMLSPYPDSTANLSNINLSWQAGFPKSCVLFLQFAEEVLYNTTWDGSLKVAVKARNIAEEVFEYQNFQERLTEVLDQLQCEKKKTQASNPEDRAEMSSATVVRVVVLLLIAYAESWGHDLLHKQLLE